MYILSEVLGVVAEFATFHLFAHGVFKRRETGNLGAALLYLILGGITLALSFWEEAALIRMVYCVVACWILAKCLFESTVFQSFFSAISFACLFVLTDVFAITIASMMNIDVDVVMSYGVIRSVYVIFCRMIMFVVVLIILGITRRKRNAVTLPFLIAIMPGSIVGMVLGIYFCQSVQYTGQDVPIPILIISAGLLYLNIMIVFYAEKMQEAIEQKHYLELSEQHYAMQEQYYEQLREDQNETRAMFHDINKYLQAMQALAAESNTEQAKEVLSQAQDLFHGIGNVVDVGNSVVNVLLSDYIAKAQDNEISFDFDISIPENLGITAVEVYVIMGNTLDNAIEACCALPVKRRYIHLQMRTFHDMLFYKIENPYAEDYAKRNKGKNHGFGLQNVKRCVEKYNGDMLIEKDDRLFKLSLHLNISI